MKNAMKLKSCDPRVQEITKTRRKQMMIFVPIMMMIMMFGMSIMCLAGEDGDAVGMLVSEFSGMLKTAGTTIGAIIAVWGIFQCILAMKREDAEGIQKNVIVVVVGALLITFSQTAERLINSLRRLDGGDGGNGGGAANT